MLNTVLAMMASALVAGSSAPPTGKPADARSPDPNERICRTTQMEGSRIQAGRVCHTRAQWDELTRQAEQQMRASSAQQERDAAHAADRGGMTFGGT